MSPLRFQLGSSCYTRAPLVVRSNGVKASREELIARLAEEGVLARPTELSPTGLLFETRVNAFGLSAFRDGLFGPMDPGSQLVAEAVAPPPRGRVVESLRWRGRQDPGSGRAARRTRARPGARFQRQEAGRTAPSRPARGLVEPGRTRGAWDRACRRRWKARRMGSCFGGRALLGEAAPRAAIPRRAGGSRPRPSTVFRRSSLR